MKKLFLTLNFLIIAAVFVGNYFYLTEGGLTLKALCSGGFALVGVINLVFATVSEKKLSCFHAVMALGLVLAMLGDIVLGFDFIIGAALFAAGHLCYFAAYCIPAKLASLDLIISAVLFAGAGSFLLFCPALSFDSPVMKWVCVVYALIISLMLGKGSSNYFREKTCLTAVLAVGSALFFFSDLMLVFDWFMGMGKTAGLLCMSTYYPAQCILAFSLYIKTVKNNKN